MRKLTLVILILVGVLILIQIFPVSRTNPEISGDIQVTVDIKQLLHRSCYDCHSHETRWPWYSYVAPVSWLIAHDVEEGRDHLNFSQWENYTPEIQAHLKIEILDEVIDGKMPLPQYLFLHPTAKISETEIELFKQWAATAGG